MNAARAAELRASLANNLDIAGYGAGTLGRVRWLFDHLEEYLGRWIGFYSEGRIPIGAIVNSDLHTMLLVGIEATDVEIRSLDGAENLEFSWRRFVAVVRNVHANSDPGVSLEMGERLADARCELSRLLTGTA
jgi:hypothetical protein